MSNNYTIEGNAVINYNAERITAYKACMKQDLANSSDKQKVKDLICELFKAYSITGHFESKSAFQSHLSASFRPDELSVLDYVIDVFCRVPEKCLNIMGDAPNPVFERVIDVSINNGFQYFEGSQYIEKNENTLELYTSTFVQAYDTKAVLDVMLPISSYLELKSEIEDVLVLQALQDCGITIGGHDEF